MPINAARRLLASVWDGKSALKLPIDPKQIARAQGIRIIPDPTFELEGISGEFDNEGGTPVIRYNPEDSVKRQRFTLAHELGHFALNHGHAFRDTKKNFSLSHYDPREVAANKFAAEILMPEVAVRILIEQRKIMDVSRLAELFDVSLAAMKFRLENLGYL